MKKYFCLVLILFSLAHVYCIKPGTDKARLGLFIEALAADPYDKTTLYDKYFYAGAPGEAGRSEAEIRFYKDSLFAALHADIAAKPEILKLKAAREKYAKEDLFNYYYDGQKDAIYVIVVKTSDGPGFYYALMYKGRIVSLMPSEILDHQIIGWR